MGNAERATQFQASQMAQRPPLRWRRSSSHQTAMTGEKSRRIVASHVRRPARAMMCRAGRGKLPAAADDASPRGGVTGSPGVRASRCLALSTAAAAAASVLAEAAAAAPVTSRAVSRDVVLRAAAGAVADARAGNTRTLVDRDCFGRSRSKGRGSNRAASTARGGTLRPVLTMCGSCEPGPGIACNPRYDTNDRRLNIPCTTFALFTWPTPQAA